MGPTRAPAVSLFDEPDAPPVPAPRHPQLELARFETLVARSEELRARRLPFDELRELSQLYRSQSARLSRLRDRSADPDAIRHLNALCVRAYSFLYSASPSSRTPGELRGWRGWNRDLSIVAARAWRAVGLAWVLLLLGALIGGALVSSDPAALYAMLPVGFGYSADRIDRLWASAEARADFMSRDQTPTGVNLLFGSQLLAHNTRVGILSFATGMLAGIPTVMLQLYNGMMLGAFSGLFLRDAWPITFAAWLLPHAVPELTAITLCCAGGLVLGGAIAAPGRRSRRRAIREDSVVALTLVATAIPLFFLAAVTESFIRESTLGTTPRLSIAAFYFLALVAGHLALAKRLRRQQVDTSWLQDVGRQTR